MLLLTSAHPRAIARLGLPLIGEDSIVLIGTMRCTHTEWPPEALLRSAQSMIVSPHTWGVLVLVGLMERV